MESVLAGVFAGAAVWGWITLVLIAVVIFSPDPEPPTLTNLPWDDIKHDDQGALHQQENTLDHSTTPWL